MERTINAIKTLRETLETRNAELKEALSKVEDQIIEAEEESEEREALIKLYSRLEQEERFNDLLKKELSLCDYCKLAGHSLCEWNCYCDLN